MSSPLCEPQRCTPAPCIIQRFADGDTCTVAVRCTCPESYHVVRVRLADIDSAEPYGETRNEALRIKGVLDSQFKYKRGELYLRKKNSDRFGRVIGDIRINGKMLTQSIIEQGLGWLIT